MNELTIGKSACGDKHSTGKGKRVVVYGV